MARIKRALNLLRSDTLGALLINATGRVAAFVLVIEMARLLSQEDFASASFARTWVFLIGPLCGLGYGSVVARFVPQYIAKGNADLAKRLLRHLYIRITCISATVAVLSAGVLLLVPGLVPSAYVIPTCVAAAGIPLYTIALSQVWVARACEMKIAAFLPLLLLQPLVLAVLIWAQYTLVGTSSALIVCVLFDATLVFAVLLGQFWPNPILSAKEPPVSPVSPHVEDDPQWRSMAWAMFASVLATNVILRFPSLYLGTVLSSQDFAVFFVAISIATTLQFAQLPITAIFLPKMSRAHGLREQGKFVSLAKQGTLFASLGALVGCICIAVAGPTLFHVVNLHTAGSTAILYLLLADQLITASGAVIGPALTVTGHHWYSIRLMVGRCLATLAGVPLATFYSGALGACAANLVISSVWLAIATLQLRYVIRREKV